MDNNTLIKVDHVSKKYCKSLRKSMIYGMKDILRNSLGLSANSEVLRDGEFWAVDDISFELKRGETLGLIGPNGAGKTTLLKMLNGIFWPDKGKISINGKVGALIEVGAGFHPSLSGRDNVYINAAILGMTKKEVDFKFDSIIDFAGIGDFIDAPVKHYSTGMYVRLGFAIAVHCDPDILLVDEVLAVGDENFQSKCMQKIGQLVKNGTTVLLVSHSMNLIGKICHRGLLLNDHKIICDCSVNEAVNEYYKLVSRQSYVYESEKTIVPVDKRVKSAKLSICDFEGKEKNIFYTGETVIFKWRFLTGEPIMNPVIHMGIIGDTYHAYNIKEDDIKIDFLDSKTEVTLKVDFLGLSSGVYRISVALSDNNMISTYYMNWNVKTIELRSDKYPWGRFIFKHSWDIKHNVE